MSITKSSKKEIEEKIDFNSSLSSMYYICSVILLTICIIAVFVRSQSIVLFFLFFAYFVLLSLGVSLENQVEILKNRLEIRDNNE